MLTILVLVLLVSLSISFFCSVLEACVLSMSHSDIASVEERNPAMGKIWRSFRQDLQAPLAVILILNTFAHTIGAIVSGAYFEMIYGERWLVVFSIAVSFVMIQWTEVLPKTLGANYNRRLAPLIGLPLHWLTRLLKPLVVVVHFLNRPFELKTKKGGPATAQEIRALALSALMSKQMAPQQAKIISAGAELSDKTASDVMVPSAEISYLDADMPLQEAFIKAHLDAHTRYPLCENNDLSQLVGYVNFKELVSVMNMNLRNPTLRGIARPLLTVPVEEPCLSIIRSLVGGRWHMAIVKDAAGQTVGLLTMEDLLEELVGDIEDEFDRLPQMIHPLGDETFSVGGGLLMGELASRLSLEAPDPNESISTWITHRLGRTPQQNDSVRYGDWTFRVRRTRRQRVFEVMISKN